MTFCTKYEQHISIIYSKANSHFEILQKDESKINLLGKYKYLKESTSIDLAVKTQLVTLKENSIKDDENPKWRPNGW